MNLSAIVLTEGFGIDKRVLASRGVNILFDGDLVGMYPLLRTVKIIDVMPMLEPMEIKIEFTL